MADSNQTKLYGVKETAWGEAPNQSKTFKEIPFTSENLALGKGSVDIETIRSDRQRKASRKVSEMATGGFTSELSADNFDDYFESVLMADSIVTLSEPTIAVTFAAAGDTITRDSGTFSAAEQKCKYVLVADAVDTGNNGIKRVVSMNSTVITCASGEITDDEAGDTISLTGKYMQNGTKVVGLLLEKQFTDFSKNIHYIGQVCQSCNLNLQSESIAIATFDFIGKQGVFGFGGDQSASAGDGSPTAAVNNAEFNTSADVAHINEDGSATAEAVASLELTINNNLRRRPQLGSLFTRSPGKGRLEVSGTITIYFETGAQYLKFINDTELEIQFLIKDASNNGIGVTIFALKYDGDPNPEISGSDTDVMLALPIRAHEDTAEAKTIQFDFL